MKIKDLWTHVQLFFLKMLKWGGKNNFMKLCMCNQRIIFVNFILTLKICFNQSIFGDYGNFIYTWKLLLEGTACYASQLPASRKFVALRQKKIICIFCLAFLGFFCPVVLWSIFFFKSTNQKSYLSKNIKKININKKNKSKRFINKFKKKNVKVFIKKNIYKITKNI